VKGGPSFSPGRIFRRRLGASRDAGRVIGRFAWGKMALTGNSTLELALYVVGSGLLDGIGAASCKQRESHRAQNRHGLHSLTLDTKLFIASELKG
jgi:hypothetical protein